MCGRGVGSGRMTEEEMLIGVAVDLLCRKLLRSTDVEPRARLTRLASAPTALIYEDSRGVEHTFVDAQRLELAEAIFGQPDDPADLHLSAAEQRGQLLAISLAVGRLARWVKPGESLELRFDTHGHADIVIKLRAQVDGQILESGVSLSTRTMGRTQAPVLADVMLELRISMRPRPEITAHEQAAIARSEHYARSPETRHVALPAGVYVCHVIDEDGETELVDQQGGLWDPNANYGRIGMWVRDGEPVAYGSLKPGETAVLLEPVYLSAADAEGLG
jgi:hypothetical protein